jgi:hypothetical protein
MDEVQKSSDSEETTLFLTNSSTETFSYERATLVISWLSVLAQCSQYNNNSLKCTQTTWIFEQAVANSCHLVSDDGKYWIWKDIQGVSKKSFTMVFQMLLRGALRKHLHLKPYKLSFDQGVEWWIACTPISINVFVTPATKQHLKYHCKALFETLQYQWKSHWTVTILGKTLNTFIQVFKVVSSFWNTLYKDKFFVLFLYTKPAFA